MITTASGAKRLGGETRGLSDWESTELSARLADDQGHRHPCRHGPPLSHPIVGDVIGFALDGARSAVVPR